MQRARKQGAENGWACFRGAAQKAGEQAPVGTPKRRLSHKPGGAHPRKLAVSSRSSRPHPPSPPPNHQPASPQHRRHSSTMAPKQKKGGTGELQVSIEHFIRTRDQVCILLSLLLLPCCDATASRYRHRNTSASTSPCALSAALYRVAPPQYIVAVA
jgi:hypothetical protein